MSRAEVEGFIREVKDALLNRNFNVDDTRPVPPVNPLTPVEKFKRSCDMNWARKQGVNGVVISLANVFNETDRVYGPLLRWIRVEFDASPDDPQEFITFYSESV